MLSVLGWSLCMCLSDVPLLQVVFLCGLSSVALMSLTGAAGVPGLCGLELLKIDSFFASVLGWFFEGFGIDFGLLF